MNRSHRDFWEMERRNRRQTVALVIVFLLLFCALGLGLDFVVGTLRIRSGQLIGFPLLTLLAFCIGSVQSLISYYGGAALVLTSAHARKLNPDSPKHQMVLDVVHEMALASRLPVPQVYIIDDPAPNAFATGRDPAHSVVCVTQGLVDEMDREELQGVLGHELAHIRDYDIRTMMMIAVLVGGVAMLADFFMRWSFFGGFGRSDRDSDQDGEGNLIIVVIVFVLVIVAPLFSQLIAMAVSRQREYLSDAASVEFTRNPRALLRALEHIARTESPLANASRGIAHLFIVNPLESADGTGEGLLDNLLSTHPPLASRIERLHEMAGESGSNEPTAGTQQS
jgi:heat shock protein HtpX